MIPIYFLKDGVELPEEGTYYIVARNGIFLRKDTGLVQATVRVDRIAFLQEVTTTAKMRLPKLSAEELVRVLLFFRRVYQRHQSEAVILLHYSATTREYLLHCPDQRVSAASVAYAANQRFPGYQLVGTIHSHASMDAFHSGVDDHDERHFDGLHITIGRVDQPYFTISCSIVVNNQRFHLEPQETIEGIQAVEWQPVPKVTYRRRSICRAPGSFLFDINDVEFGSLGLGLTSGSEEPKQQFYDMTLPNAQDYRHIKIPGAWIDRVKHGYCECTWVSDPKKGPWYGPSEGEGG